MPGVRVVQTRATSAPFVGVLDGMSNIAVAYSLRKLRSAYTGSAVRVRRSSDSTEQDIGFDSSGDFNSSAFSSFVGGGTGYVKTWYDQSGNSQDGTQPAETRQPTIVLNYVNSKPAILLDGSNDFINVPDAAITFSPLSIILNAKFNAMAGMIVGDNAGTNQRLYVPYTGVSSQFRYYVGGTTYAGGSAGDTNWHIHSVRYASSPGTISAWINGSAVTSGSASVTGSITNLNIGSYAEASEFASAYVTDVIMLQSQISSSDHNAIGQNLATRYGQSWTTV